jgi:hypothetical protein
MATGASDSTANIKDLKADPRNARKRTTRSADMIKESLEKYGPARSVVIDEFGTLIAGHGTVEAAKKAGVTKVRIVEPEKGELIAVRRSDLTPEEKVSLGIADNRTSDLSDWDASLLKELDKEFDLSGLFFQDELEILYRQDEAETADADPNAEWEAAGMPEFENENLVYRKLIVSFEDEAGVAEFFRLIGQTYTENTRSITFPEQAEVARVKSQPGELG